MARPATGRVIERDAKRGRVFALRFTAYGERHYVTLGTRRTGWTEAKAEQELADTLTLVRKGIWRPPAPSRPGRARRPELPRVRVRVAGGEAAGGPRRAHARRLRVGALLPPAAVLQEPPAVGDHGAGGRPLQAAQGARADDARREAGRGRQGRPARAFGEHDQQDDHPSRADPGGRGRVRADRRKPRQREATPVEGGAATAAVRTARTGSGAAAGSNSYLGGGGGRCWRRSPGPGCGSRRRSNWSAATSTSRAARSPSRSRRRTRAFGSST